MAFADVKGIEHLTLIEPEADGHRMQYVRRIVREAIRRGAGVRLVTLAESLDHPACRAALAEGEGRIETRVLDLPAFNAIERRLTEDFRRQGQYYRMVRDFYCGLNAQERETTFFLPSFNRCDKATALMGSPFGRSPWGAIVMRDTFHHPAMGIASPVRRSDRIKERLLLRLMRDPALRRLFTIDEALPEYVAARYPALAPRLRYVPDPVEMTGSLSRAEARARFEIPENRIVVLTYGVLNDRKRLDVLLDALSHPEVPAEISLLATGLQSESTPALFTAASEGPLRGRLFQRDDYISSEDEYAAFRAADLVWVGYRDHFTMSGVLLQSGATGLPVLATDEGLIGWITRRYGHGLTVDASDPQAVRKALIELASSAERRESMGFKGRALAQTHSAARFAPTILDGLAST